MRLYRSAVFQLRVPLRSSTGHVYHRLPVPDWNQSPFGVCFQASWNWICYYENKLLKNGDISAALYTVGFDFLFFLKAFSVSTLSCLIFKIYSVSTQPFHKLISEYLCTHLYCVIYYITVMNKCYISELFSLSLNIHILC